MTDKEQAAATQVQDNALAVIQQGGLAKKDQWIQERDEALSLARSIKAVTDDCQQEYAGTAQTTVQKLVKDLARERLDVTRPIDAFKKQIVDQEKQMVRDLLKEYDRLRALNSGYLTAKAAEAERERRKQQAEYERQAQEQAALRDIFGDEDEGAEEIVIPPEPPQQIAKIKSATQKVVEVWHQQIVDANAVPREFCLPDERLIRLRRDGMVAAGQEPVVAGVQFWKTMDARAK